MDKVKEGQILSKGSGKAEYWISWIEGKLYMVFPNGMPPFTAVSVSDVTTAIALAMKELKNDPDA